MYLWLYRSAHQKPRARLRLVGKGKNIGQQLVQEAHRVNISWNCELSDYGNQLEKMLLHERYRDILTAISERSERRI